MKWEETHPGYTSTEADAHEDTVNVLDIMWKHVADVVIPLSAEKEWDHICVEIWSDSGRIVVYPSLSKEDRRANTSGCQVYFERLENIVHDIDSLLDTSNLTEDELDRKMDQLHQSWMQDILMTYRRSDIKDIALQIWTYDDEVIYDSSVPA